MYDEDSDDEDSDDEDGDDEEVDDEDDVVKKEDGIKAVGAALAGASQSV